MYYIKGPKTDGYLRVLMASEMFTSFERRLLLTSGEITHVYRLGDLGHGDLFLADLLFGLMSPMDLLKRRPPPLSVVHIDLALHVAP